MHETLKKLYRDHANFFKLMDLLDAELQAMEKTGTAASELMKELVSYTRNYSDSIHHPIEDHLYQLLLIRTDDGRESMERLLGDHQILMQLTRELNQALASDNNQDVISSGRDFLNQQRDHMKFEEEKAFLLLRENLGTSDFEYATGALPADEDPLRDPLMQSEYPNLFAACKG